jgi:hypothetical protein
MSEVIIITKQELDILKSNGSVYVCQSCRDFKNKIVLLAYKPNKIHQIFDGVCDECFATLKKCSKCKFNN